MANKGTIKIIRDGDGGIIVDTVNGVEVSYDFKQPFHKELFLKVGDNVRYETVASSLTKQTVAVFVSRVTVGTILSIDGPESGTIQERGTKTIIPFFQPFLKEVKLSVGDMVRYDLILLKGAEAAINVHEIHD